MPSTIRRSHSFSAIYILEYLASGHDLTGTDLFRILQPLGKQADIHIQLFSVSKKQDFFESLAAIEQDCITHSRGPLLHLETHGDADGIAPEAGSQEAVGWGELKPSLIALNTLSQMNLLVTMAACHGIELARTLMVTDVSPMWGFLGPNEQVLPSDIRRGFQAFYVELIRTLDLNEAKQALRAADHSNPDCWELIPVEVFFAFVYGEYSKRFESPRSRLETLDRIVAAYGERKPLRFADRGQLRRRLATEMDRVEPFFERLKERFLMLDTFSDNKERFPITRSEAMELYRTVTDLRDTSAA